MNRPLSPDECNCFALRQAARHVTQIYERHLNAVGLTAAQYTILAKLARKPDQSMADLADAMVMERTTVVRALKPLQRDGLVVTDTADHDARTFVFRLTEAGESAFDEASKAWRAAQNEFESQFGKSRAKSLRAELFSITG